MAPSSLLLDSHIVLWMLNQDPISTNAKRVIGQAPSLYCSAASIWELSIKAASGKLDVPETLLSAIRQSGIMFLDVTPEHAYYVRSVDLPHGDPFDKLLVAQARHEKLTLLTADATLIESRHPFILSALI
jgi:PIN domain nuclease of toxin-antitoxin system